MLVPQVESINRECLRKDHLIASLTEQLAQTRQKLEGAHSDTTERSMLQGELQNARDQLSSLQVQ
jgi:predicted  nucleic acid-binding Zn-ribbon protein